MKEKVDPVKARARDFTRYHIREYGGSETEEQLYGQYLAVLSSTQRKERAKNWLQCIGYTAGVILMLGGCGHSCTYSSPSGIERYADGLRTASRNITSFTGNRSYFKDRLGIEIPVSLDNMASMLDQRADSIEQTAEYRVAKENGSTATKNGMATAGLGLGLVIATGVAGGFADSRIRKTTKKRLAGISK